MLRAARRSLVPALAAAMVFASAPAFALQPADGKPADRPANQPPPGRGQDRATRPGGPGGPGQNISVEGAMKAMNRGLRQLKGQIADAGKKDDNLRIIGDIQRAAIAAKSQPVPPSVLSGAKDDAARAKLAVTFRSELMSAVRALLDMEQDVLDGKTDAAKAKLDNLAKLRDHGHEAMGVSEEEDEPGHDDKAKKNDKDGRPSGEKHDGEKHESDKPK